jgi:hypothetical protein
MVITGTAIVVMLGSSALTDTQSTSEIERAENSMTLFNTRAAMVALGDSPSQSVAFGRGSGDIETVPDRGWLRVTHSNYTGSGGDEVIFNETLGAVVYTNDDTTIAYQGGGVWRKDVVGESRMVSPPEFHYRAATLTLPVVRVQNAAAGSGGTTARIEQVSQTRRVYPSTTKYSVTGTKYNNPVVNGTVNVTVQSQYYQGWANYFRDRTDGTITVSDDTNRTNVELTSLSGSLGDFDLPTEGNSLSVNGLSNNHSITEYTLNLSADKGGNGNSGNSGKNKDKDKDNNGSNFPNMHWSFYADNGNEMFELHFYSKQPCNNDRPSESLDIGIYYRNTSGSETIHEEWQNSGINVTKNNDFSIDCSNGRLDMNLMSDTNLSYGDISLTGSNNKWKYGTKIDEVDVASETDSFTFHDADTGNYTDGDEAELGFLINHYLQMLGPRFNLEVTDGPGGSSSVDESGSSGSLKFDDNKDSGQYITFLHITENKVNVEFD